MIASQSAEAIASCSRGLLDRKLTAAGSLLVLICEDGRETRGAWSHELGLARGGGGGAITLGPGSVYVALILQHASALIPDADPPRIVNRHVRPLLAALGKLGVPSMYGGRDFISSRKSPIAWVGFQHSADTNRAAFEAIVGVDTPIAKEPRRTFLDRAPHSLHDLGCKHDASTIADRITSAYLQTCQGLAVEAAFVGEADVANGGSEEGSEQSSELDEIPAEPAITVAVEVGVVGARRVAGLVSVFGDFYASREIVPRIHAGLAAGLDAEACLAAAVSGAVLIGLPSTEPLARVITAARSR